MWGNIYRFIISIFKDENYDVNRTLKNGQSIGGIFESENKISKV
jgi:hypothetical protein